MYFSVVDDENPTEVTAGAIVTVTVSLRRAYMKDIIGDSNIKEQQQLKYVWLIENNFIIESSNKTHIFYRESEEVNEDGEKPVPESLKKEVNKKPVWMKQQKKSTAGKKSKNKSQTKAQQAKEKAAAAAVAAKNVPAPTPPNGISKKSSRVPSSDEKLGISYFINESNFSLLKQ